MTSLDIPAWNHDGTIRRTFDGSRKLAHEEAVALSLCLNVPLGALVVTEPVAVMGVVDGDEAYVAAVDYMPMVTVGAITMTPMQFASVWNYNHADPLHEPDIQIDWLNWDGTSAPKLIRESAIDEAEEDLMRSVEKFATALGVSIDSEADLIGQMRQLHTERRKRGL